MIAAIRVTSGELKEVPQSQHWENIIIPESKWFNISENHAYQSLVSMFNDYEVYKSKANELMNKNKKKFTLDKMSEALATIIEETVPKPVSLKLPKLKLGTENKSSKIKLPNLSDTLTEGVQ